MSSIPSRFPKIQCPFYRESETDDSKSYIVDELRNSYEWILESDTEVIEKLHGTNVAVHMEHGEVEKVAVRHGNREMNELDPFGSEAHQSVTRGVQNSMNSGFLYQFKNGWIFGEVVGPSFHNNPYQLDEDLFVPFDWIREHCSYDEVAFNSGLSEILDWMSNSIYSHFKARMEGMKPSEASISNGYFTEGVIFVKNDFAGRIKPDDLTTKSTNRYDSVAVNIAKIRRDMFQQIDVESEFPKINI